MYELSIGKVSYRPIDGFKLFSCGGFRLFSNADPQDARGKNYEFIIKWIRVLCSMQNRGVKGVYPPLI